MSIKKISCGGFKIDNETIVEEDGILKATGDSLPVVTSDDEGKVLTVDSNGEWGAEDDTVFITATYSGEGYSFDKTYSEIVDAISQGKPCILKRINNSNNYFYSFIGMDKDGKIFFALSSGDTSFEVARLYLNSQSQLSMLITIKSFLPQINDELRNGATLVTTNGIWNVADLSPFVVTLTPTALDFSGTMDKTVGEIAAAYDDGREIRFKVLTSADTNVIVPLSFVGKASSKEYPNFGAEVVKYANNVMIVAHTDDTDDPTKATYATTTYTLTPAT